LSRTFRGLGGKRWSRNSEPITNPSRGIGDSPSDNPCPLSKWTGLCAAYFWKTSPITPILDLLNTLAKGYSMMEIIREASGGVSHTIQTWLLPDGSSMIEITGEGSGMVWIRKMMWFCPRPPL
jgi:hypothetical protein